MTELVSSQSKAVVIVGVGCRWCWWQSNPESKYTGSNEAQLSTTQAAQDGVEYSGAAESDTRTEWTHVSRAVVTRCVRSPPSSFPSLLILSFCCHRVLHWHVKIFLPLIKSWNMKKLHWRCMEWKLLNWHYFIKTSCASCSGAATLCPLPWLWHLTFWPWKWCPSHMWHGLPLCQF